MKTPLIALFALILCAFNGRAETLDEALARFLAGETLTRQEIDGITDMQGFGPLVDGKRNNGSIYLQSVKRSIVDPARHGGWPTRSEHVYEERTQAKTYRELKAIYEKDKSPVVAYALVCPAMYVNDFALLPELVAKIGENKHLKAHFDKVYTTRWKPLLDPDF
jgi:hypothetical protein